MKKIDEVPKKSYGVVLQTQTTDALDTKAEQIKYLGYAIIDSGFSPSEVTQLSDEFEKVYSKYLHKFDSKILQKKNELYTIRAPLLLDSSLFLKLACNTPVITLLKKLILGKFILNQQNGIINPPMQDYNQGSWHRDLPYQHFTSSRPIAINALFCLDDFTLENGATYVLPASHSQENFPSPGYIREHAQQVVAKAGSFLILDCMLFHCGGFNQTLKARRAVNHVYTIPILKQQINIPKNLDSKNLSELEKDLLGYKYVEPENVEHFLESR